MKYLVLHGYISNRLIVITICFCCIMKVFNYTNNLKYNLVFMVL